MNDSAHEGVEVGLQGSSRTEFFGDGPESGFGGGSGEGSDISIEALDDRGLGIAPGNMAPGQPAEELIDLG